MNTTNEPRRDISTRNSIGLPSSVLVCLFDLDGVLTQTATLHASAWKEMFDEYLQAYSEETHKTFVPFSEDDYKKYVDGKLAEHGASSFLQARNILLPEGTRDDPPGIPTVWGLTNKKTAIVLKTFTKGIKPYEGSVRYLRAARHLGVRCAVVSSSAHAGPVLEAAGIADLFEARIDGLTAAEQNLPGKPAPDMFIAGAKALNAAPSEAAVFEDALSGVEAGRAGNFAYVVGVNRTRQADALRAAGADVVVDDLGNLLKNPLL